MKPATDRVRSILIADDEEAIRESLFLILEEEGYRCTAVADGAAALEQACTHSFDLIVMDFLMPKRKGVQLLVEIIKCSPNTPVLILSSYYNAEMAASAMNHGVKQYLLKPVDFEELVVTVRQILSEVSLS